MEKASSMCKILPALQTKKKGVPFLSTKQTSEAADILLIFTG